MISAQIDYIKVLFKAFINTVPNIRGVVLFNPNGSFLTSIFSSNFDKNQVSDVAFNIVLLIKKFQTNLTTGIIERIIIEGKEGCFILVSCDENIVLCILTSKNIAKGWLFFEIKNLVNKINIILKNTFIYNKHIKSLKN
ncbi:MAG: roadblock/LC7 domain-containing protein [Xenococcaceae cyanobacterium MO_167.B27]|nr:roadblock/LC7 domain-containing protein [Xenococcaceae cyanobacterium MO_167.B27]